MKRILFSIAALAVTTACQNGNINVGDDTGPAGGDDSGGETDPPEVEDCLDGVDNDGDGLIDCFDSDCDTQFSCQTETDCADGVDNDNDGTADCLDTDCDAACVEDCADGVDNDLDGDIDCQDSTCAGLFPCDLERDCEDGVDDDGDGLIDCEDGDCASELVCQSEQDCADGLDNDGDGDTDCADGDCIGSGCGGFASRVTGTGDAVWDIYVTSMYNTCSGSSSYVQEGGWNVEAHNIAGTVQALDTAGIPTATCNWGYANAVHHGRFDRAYVAGTYSSALNFSFDPVQRTGFFVDAGCGTSGSAFLPKFVFPYSSAIALTREGRVTSSNFVRGLWFEGSNTNTATTSSYKSSGSCSASYSYGYGATMQSISGVDSYRAGTP